MIFNITLNHYGLRCSQRSAKINNIRNISHTINPIKNFMIVDTSGIIEGNPRLFFKVLIDKKNT